MFYQSLGEILEIKGKKNTKKQQIFFQNGSQCRQFVILQEDCVECERIQRFTVSYLGNRFLRKISNIKNYNFRAHLAHYPSCLDKIHP